MKLNLTKNQWLILVAVSVFAIYWFFLRKKKQVVAEKIDTKPPVLEKESAPQPQMPMDLNSMISQSMANKGNTSEVGYTRFGDMCPEGMTYDQTTYKCSPKMESGYTRACPSGYSYNYRTLQCDKLESTYFKRCASGEQYNPTTKKCEQLPLEDTYANHHLSQTGTAGHGDIKSGGGRINSGFGLGRL